MAICGELLGWEDKETLSLLWHTPSQVAACPTCCATCPCGTTWHFSGRTFVHARS